MDELMGQVCGHVLCTVCGQCHEPGCPLQYALCETAREMYLFDLAERLGYEVTVSGEEGLVFFLREDGVVAFAYTEEGMIEASFWLEGMAFAAQLPQPKQLPMPSWWSRVKVAILGQS